MPIEKGKRFSGDHFYAIKTEADAKVEAELHEKYGKKEDALDLQNYLHRIGKSDPVHTAAVLAFTKVKRATVEDWEEILKDFGFEKPKADEEAFEAETQANTKEGV